MTMIIDEIKRHEMGRDITLPNARFYEIEIKHGRSDQHLVEKMNDCRRVAEIHALAITELQSRLTKEYR